MFLCAPAAGVRWFPSAGNCKKGATESFRYAFVTVPPDHSRVVTKSIASFRADVNSLIHFGFGSGRFRHSSGGGRFCGCGSRLGLDFRRQCLGGFLGGALGLSLGLALLGLGHGFFLPLFVRQASTALLVLIAAGGVLYTLGAWFYARQGFRYHHMVWHLLINLAVVAHFIGIVFFLY